jgi:hypothetical protein
MPDETIEIPNLTQDEIQTLQVDAALRLIGQNTVLLTRLNRQIGQALIEKGQADIKLSKLKEDKKTLIELQRALKVIAEKA